MLAIAAALLLAACTPTELRLTSEAIATDHLADQCGRLRIAKDDLLEGISRLDDADLERLEEINALNFAICTTDIEKLIREVEEMKERAR